MNLETKLEPRLIEAVRANLEVKFFFAAILGAMPPEEVGELCEVISEELRQTDDEDTIRFVLRPVLSPGPVAPFA